MGGELEHEVEGSKAAEIAPLDHREVAGMEMQSWSEVGWAEGSGMQMERSSGQ